MKYDSIHGAIRQKAIDIRSTIYLELEIDIIEYRRMRALNKVDTKFTRQIASMKRRKSIDELQQEAITLRERINKIADDKIIKAKEKAAKF